MIFATSPTTTFKFNKLLDHLAEIENTKRGRFLFLYVKRRQFIIQQYLDLI